MSSTNTPSPNKLTAQIVVASLGRLLLNTARRFPYTFAGALSRGLGVPLTAITSLIAVNQVTGILALFFGPLTDKWGYRATMLGGLAMLAVGMLVGGVLPFYGVMLVVVFLAGLGKSIFDPALQAYIGEHIPYNRRGRVIGLTEMSWAGSSLLAIPLIGLLIDRFGWQSPFLVLGGLGLLSFFGLATLLPSPQKTEIQVQVNSPQTWRQMQTAILQTWQQLIQSRAALGALGFTFAISAANDNIFVVYGLWLGTTFNLGVMAVGAATVIIGVSELVGESLTAAFADYFGLFPTVVVGLLLSALCYIILPFLAQTLSLALVALFLVFFAFEFTLVTSVSLFTEFLPEARATMMAGYLAAASLGRITGAFMGSAIWASGGIMAIGISSAIISILGLVSLLWGTRARTL